MFTKLLSVSLVVALQGIVAGHNAHMLALAPQRAAIRGGQRAAQAARGGTVASAAAGGHQGAAIAALCASGQRIVALFDFDFDIEHVAAYEFLLECTFNMCCCLAY